MVRNTIATLAVVCAALTASAGVRHPTPTPKAASAGYGILAAPDKAWAWPPLLPVPVQALSPGSAVAVDLEAEQAKWEAAVVAWRLAETLGRVKAQAAAAQSSRPHRVVPVRGQVSDQGRPDGSGRCGGDLPPCSVMFCESGGNLRAQNPRSSASGKWQVIDSTWRTEDTNGDGKADSFGGYARAMDAPEAVQDERARQLYAGGAGRRHWVC